jgi:hypothetical protein
MAASHESAEGHAADACAELRLSVGTRCDEARAAARALTEAGERSRALKRDLVAAQRRLTAAVEAADPKLRTAQKEAAHDEYQQARQLAQTDAERAEAAKAWAHALDRVNRSGRLTERNVTKVKAEVAGIEEALHAAERSEQATRISTEAAESACLDARVLLAACEENLVAPEGAGRATVFEPHAATGGHALKVQEAGVGEPLVIESMVSGDRLALELAAAAIAEHGGASRAEAQLQLQELVDAIISSASADGYLVFDDRNPFWTHLSYEESRDVVAALARLGFQFEPAEGWHAGRAPMPADLSMALAYAGLDPRNMRALPSAEDLRALPESIGVDARAFLAAHAPDLAVDHLVRILGRRAAQLEPLWDIWGHVRPILLGERRSLGSLTG